MKSDNFLDPVVNNTKIFFDVRSAPLSPAQRCFIAVSMPDGQTTTGCNVLLQVEVAACTAGEVADCLAKLAKAHDALRGYIAQLGNGLVCLQFIDIRRVSPADFAVEEVGKVVPQDEAARMSSQIIDHAVYPLIRASIGQSRSGKILITIVAHHLIVDGRSAEILAKQIERSFRGMLILEMNATNSFFHACNDIAGIGKSGALAQDRQQWIERFRTGPRETYFPASEKIDPAGGEAFAFSLALPGQVQVGLAQLAASLSVSRFAVVVTLFAGVTRRVLNQADIVILVPVHGRTAANLVKGVGMYALLIPLLVEASADSLESRIQRVYSDLVWHAANPFFTVADLASALSFDIFPRYPISGVMCNKGTVVSSPDWLAEGKGRHRRTGRKVRFDLQCLMAKAEGTIFLKFIYRSDVLSADRTEDIAYSVLRALSGLTLAK
jgi:Condensation domain